jgi:hypothetical protein
MRSDNARCVSGFALGAVFGTALLLAPAAASAQGTPEQRAACEGDAMRLCGAFVPDVDRITACMIQKRSFLTPRCAVYFRKGKPKMRRTAG